jgi:diguanylate cyclase (GGDEF)-like protein
MKKTILCIDDIKTNLFIIESLIEDLADDLYDVELAQSASDGLDILLKKSIDIILLDVMMPDIDGLEAAKMIKSNKKTKDIPIIFVTAKKDDESIGQCYASGGDDYVNKPFNHIELLARISFHLRLKENERLLQLEKEYAQSIIDLQENIIFVTDSKSVINANKSFLNFFEIESLQEFKIRYQCISKSFMEEDGYFNLSMFSDDKAWIKELVKLSESKDVVVKMLKDNQEFIFNININSFDRNYILTLTDITQISQKSSKFEYEASFDALTKIYNRNMFHRLMSDKINLSKKENKTFVFVLFDIDYFKKVNDTYGHLVGDDVLVNISSLIKSHIRDDDIFARWGGEEFVLAFDVTLQKGVTIAQSLRKHIERYNFKVVKDVTCSFGVTEFRKTDTLDSMIKRADEALYEAKESGRNKVCQA